MVLRRLGGEVVWLSGNGTGENKRFSSPDPFGFDDMVEEDGNESEEVSEEVSGEISSEVIVIFCFTGDEDDMS